MELNQQQKKAVEYLEGPLLVLAGPGTGKTQLLSDKVAYILQNTDTNPENILCLTFTDTGARNMRDRLKRTIGKDAVRINIGTYHAFGQEILSQYKAYSPDYDRRLDGAIDEVTQYKIIKQIQESLPVTDILRGDAIDDIRKTIGDAKGANLSADDLAEIAEQNTRDAEMLAEPISQLLKEVVPRDFIRSYNNAYKPIYEVLEQYTERAAGDSLPTVRIYTVLAQELKEAITEASDKESIRPLSKWRDDFFVKDAMGEYQLDGQVANKKLASLAQMMRQYEEYLHENGLYDFNDMIQEAARLLQDDLGFKATLQERYQYIMLDEFQDTNPAQLSIVEELTDYEKPMVMAVGDDDQAIYEFQGANASNLTNFMDHYSAEVVTLTENYRSTQEILDFSHKIIEQIPARDRFGDKMLHAARQKDPEKSQIYRYEFNSSDAECGFVAREIGRLVRSGVPQSRIAVISQKRKYFEPLLPYLKAEKGVKIAYEKRDDLLANEQIHEIITILRYVHEVASEQPATVQLMEVLAYPFWDLSVMEIVRLVGEARAAHKAAFDYLAERGSEKLQTVLGFLAQLVAKSYTEPLEVMLDYVIGTAELPGYRSPFLRFYTEVASDLSAYVCSDKNSDQMMPETARREHLRSYRTFTLYENLAALRGKLAKHFGDKRLMLGDLIQLVDDYTAAGVMLTSNSPYKDADEAVQILTAHGSKGMEFEYVFMIAVDNTAWGKSKGNNNRLVLPKNLTHIRHTGVTLGERLRVLYVALTRAERTLYITNALHDFQGKSPERLEYFQEYDDKNEAKENIVVSPLLPEQTVRLMYDTGDMQLREENLKNWLAAYVVESPDMRAIYQQRVEGMRMSATTLTSFIDVVYSGPMDFFKTQILQAPRAAESESQAYGSLIHETFEYVTKTGADEAAATAFFLEKLAHRDLPSEVVQKLRERGPLALATSLAEFGEILRTGAAEVNFATDKLVVNGVPVTGKIDHIVIDKAAKTIKVYDFKTGSYHKEKWQSHATLYKYQLQLLFYKMLLNHSPKYQNYRVEEAHILFVSPDPKDGKVYDKLYEYDAADEEEFMRILAAVYEQIATLKFMDDPEVFIEADQSRSLKDLKAFVELLLDKNTPV